MTGLSGLSGLSGLVGAGSDPGPAVGDGLFLEDGTSFLLLETGDFILLE